MPVFKLSRRVVLRTLGGAVVVAGVGGGASGLWLGIRKLQGARWRIPVERDQPFAPSVYLAIDTGGEVTLWCTRSEMGQGVSTALPMLIAEELDADWNRVQVRQASAGGDFDYGQLFTAASSSISSQWVELRRAGAIARQMLIAAAAASWGVSASACTTRSGTVVHAATGRQLGYGELATAAMDQAIPLLPDLKAPADYRLLGRSLARIDVPDKVTGRAIYGSDIRRPGMLRATITRPPAFGDRLLSWDDTEARAVKGVKDVLVLDQGVAVVADTTFAALQGRRRLKLEWQSVEPAAESATAVVDLLHAGLSAEGAGIAVNRGSGDRDLTAVQRMSEFHTPYVPHACMEPMNCTAHVTADRCEIWVPTQAPEGARELAATMTGLPISAVTVHITQLGGGFGRRGAQDFVADAVAVAMRSAHPVQVFWTREDDFRHSPCREASAHRLEAELDPTTSLPVRWRHRIVTSSRESVTAGSVNFAAVMGADSIPYEIPNQWVAWSAVRLPVPTTIWRSVGHSYNLFAIECFLDELAEAAAIDPLDYRLRLLPAHSRVAACLDRVAVLSNWRSRLTDNRALGIAACWFGDSSAAIVAEAVPTRDGGIAVRQVWCAVDCGLVINPDIVTAQIEGGVLFGLDAALTGRMTLSNGRLFPENFNGYQLPRLDNVPAITVEISDSARDPSGVGELGVPAIAPALANAWYAVSGRRHRQLPLLEGTS